MLKRKTPPFGGVLHCVPSIGALKQDAAALLVVLHHDDRYRA